MMSPNLAAAFISNQERNTNRTPMSTAPEGGGGSAGAHPPEPGGALSGPPALGRAMASSTSQTGVGGGTGTSRSRNGNETPIDMTETDEEDNNTSHYVNGKRRRGGVGARRPAASTASTTTCTTSSSAPAPPAMADTDGSSSNVSAQPQPPVEVAHAPAAGANKPTDSHLLGPIDVDAIVFGPGGFHHDPEAEERERLARERRLQQQQQQSASAAGGTSMPTSTSWPGFAAPTSEGSANTVDKKSSMVSNGGSNQGVVAAAAAAAVGVGAKAPGITAGVSTPAMATESGQSIKRASSASNSGDVQTESKGATFNSKPTSSAQVQSPGSTCSTCSKMETAASADGLAEVMGIGHSLWRRAVQHEVKLKKEEEAGVAILEEASAFVNAEGSTAVDSCADFIRSYLMKKNCTDRSLGTDTSCSCMKDLDEALILPVAAYIVSTWGEMSKNGKAKQLEVWISNQASDALPFILPIEIDPSDGSQPHSNKKICRNALIELLCISLPMWKKAYGRVVNAAIPAVAVATHSSRPVRPIAPSTGSWMVTGSSMEYPDVNSSVFGPMVGNPSIWAQFHAQAMASAHLATSLAQQQTAGGKSSMVESQRQDDTAASVGKQDEIPAGDMVSRQESQPISGNKGQQSAIIPVEKRWCCDKCNYHVFKSFDEARVHEETCSGIPKAADKDDTSGQLRQSASESAELQMSASKRPSVTSGVPMPALSTPIQGMSQGTVAAKSAPNPPTSNDDVKYLCDKCKIAEFVSFDDACRHESTCVGAAPEGEKSPVTAFTPRKATDEEIVADAAATFEPVLLTNLATLCKRERWADIANLISAHPLLSSATLTGDDNIKMGILHQVIASSGDINGRAGLVRSILTARPSAATIKNSHGSLPIHVLLQRNVKMKAKLKEELLRGLIHAYPASISIAGGVSKRTPLHTLFTDYLSADLCRLMLTLRPEAAKMRDKQGWLPIHIACSRHCSLVSLHLLIDAFPESIRETTGNEKTPLMLARSTATKTHPNRALIEELTKRLGGGTEAATDSKLPVNQEAKSCENTVAEGLLAVSTSAKQEASDKKEKRKLTKQEGEGVPSNPFFIGQDVWVKCGVDLQAEQEAMVVSSGKADNTKITIRWTIAGYDQTVDIGQVRAMYSAADLDKPKRETSTKSSPALSVKRVGKHHSSPRPPGTNQCGSCDACMVDDCGECRHCLDKPKFGGQNNLRKSCLNRPPCTVRSSSTKDSKTTPAERGPTRSNMNNPASTSVKSTNSAAVAREYMPPDIRVGMDIMRYFEVDGGGKSYFEGTLKRLPISSSPYYFIVYSDGDKEEISELNFWIAYSDYRVQKGMVKPSEFVPESLVVANDGRLAVVRSFRPVSNGTDTTWSYRVRFDGFSAKHDKWMLEVDLRKQTPATLKWAERVREAVKKQSSGAAKKSASVRNPKPSSPKPKPLPSARPKATGKPPRDNEGHSYPLRRSEMSIDEASPMVQKAKTSYSQETAASDTSTIRHSRRAAAADARAAMAKTAGPKRLTKGKSPSPPKDVSNNNGTTNNNTLPEISVGTRILKYFKRGNKYYQGKITKLPSPGNSFYHIRYFDGDQEDMEPNEMWKAFSDWCVANGELTLTQVRREKICFSSFNFFAHTFFLTLAALLGLCPSVVRSRPTSVRS